MCDVRCAIWTMLWVALLALPLWADEATFKADLDALTRAPHRLAGSPQGRAAGDYIIQRLHDIGIADVLTQPMNCWYTDVEQCDVQIGGKTLGLLPMRSNLVVPPCTPAQGVTAPMIYVGKGALADYGTRDPDGAIVVLDYDCGANWKRAFELGAAAILFLPPSQAIDQPPADSPHQVMLPINLVRLYIPPASAAQFDFTADHSQVTLHSRVKWRAGVGRNIIAYIPGTNPHFTEDRKRPEAMVLSAHYDSFGQAPQDAPGARSAANVAALLEAAERFKDAPRRRDLLICFFDAHAIDRQGARVFYHQLLAPKSQLSASAASHQSERQFVLQALKVLQPGGARLDGVDSGVAAAVTRMFQQQAEFLREDLNVQRQQLRLAGRADSPEYQLVGQEITRWDDLRRELGAGRIGGVDPVLYTQLRSAMISMYAGRLQELDRLIHRDSQWQAMRERIGLPWVSLHVSYDLSDAVSRWGVVVSDSTMQLYNRNNTSADNPGYYTSILAALRQAALGLSSDASLPGLETATLEDPLAGSRYCAYPLLSDGYIAGTCGIYNIALITSADGHVREGQPTDTIAHLNWRNLRQQAEQATQLVAAASDETMLSQPRVFQWLVHDNRPSWSVDRLEATGNFIGAQVTGSLREQRPAPHTLVMLFPAFNTGDPFSNLDKIADLRGIQLTPMVVTDTYGHYPLTYVRKDFYNNFGVMAVQFDDQGLVAAVPNEQTLIGHTSSLARTDIFRGRGAVTFYPAMSDVSSAVQVLGAVSDSALRRTLSLRGQSKTAQAMFFYVADLIADQSQYKVVQPNGPVLLGNSSKNPHGVGMPLQRLHQHSGVDALTAVDLWRLNESRLRTLRQRGVVDVNLETIHDDARRLLPPQASPDASLPSADGQPTTSQPLAEHLNRLTESTARSRHVYQPVRSAMNDLVHAVVVLLLLAIPFAFALERLLIGATSIYKRLGGFITIFLVTFLLLYWLHPGFAIATTPIIIFLAFTIILLSSLVIYIVLRKFHTELNAMQGHGSTSASDPTSGGGHHAVVGSRTGTLVAAINMGMSTMRRRPLRTTLTALTVVILTFTILCFASVGSELGIRTVYLGPPPVANHEAQLIHQLDFSPIDAAAIDLARGRAGAGGLVAGQWWLVRQTGDIPYTITPAPGTPRTPGSTNNSDASVPADADAPPAPLAGAAVDQQVLFVDAVMGLDPAELDRWSAMAAALSPADPSPDHVREQLRRGGAYLPQLIAHQLNLKVGDRLLLAGRPAFFAGAFDADAMQRMKNLDGQSVLPVDFQDQALKEFRKQQQQSRQGDEAPELNIQRNFVRLSPAQIAVASDRFVQAAGAELSILKIYPAQHIDTAALSADLATDLALPVWTRSPAGVQRLMFTTLTHLSGGLALFVPLILGGLIIFGTMLGSIADRQKEIYTFSALGLAPAHVGLLFFAEASVYAVVGGMGGQLLAQAVAKIATLLAQAGWIAPPVINFSSTSAMFAIVVVMATVLISAIYPASRASRSANPGVQRHWKMPRPEHDQLTMTFPFTVSAYDITGVISFLAEHFREHDDAGLGLFAVQSVRVRRDDDSGNLVLAADMALAPFDLGVTQDFQLTAQPSEIPGVDEVLVAASRHSGARGDWQRALRVFIADLRKQFLLWRTVPPEIVEQYRLKTLMELGEQAPASSQPVGDHS